MLYYDWIYKGTFTIDAKASVDIFNQKDGRKRARQVARFALTKRPKQPVRAFDQGQDTP